MHPVPNWCLKGIFFKKQGSLKSMTYIIKNGTTEGKFINGKKRHLQHLLSYQQVRYW
jgi:hypothetical protein